MKLIDLTGQRFGRLLVIRRTDDYVVPSTGKRCVRWLCRCDCGTTLHVTATQLKRDGPKATRSCGFGHQVIPEGLLRGPEYRALNQARNRCFNPNCHNFHRYGGRGIRVCDEWMAAQGQGFLAFYAHVGPRPSEGFSLDRVDVNGHYKPGNVRWATAEQQANNSRWNVRMKLFGVEHSMAEWSKMMAIPYYCLKARRRRGWPDELALTIPYGQPVTAG
jgi:hypothetical protein